MFEKIFPSYYAYLIAGLPDLEMESKKLPLSLHDFLEEVEGLLSKRDKKLVELFRLEFDNLNLLSCISSKDMEFSTLGNYSKETINEWVEAARGGDTLQGTSIPHYMKTFLEEVFSEEWKGVKSSKEDRLSALYYDFAMKSTNSFVAKWFEFNLNVRNLFVALTARKYDLNVKEFVVGENEVAQRLRLTDRKKAIDLGGEIDYFDEVVRIGEITNLYERERATDKLKWGWLEQESRFSYLTIERLLVFLLRMEMLERWNGLSEEQGEKKFRKMIGDMKENIRIPEEVRMQ